eukprot:190255_1
MAALLQSIDKSLQFLESSEEKENDHQLKIPSMVDDTPVTKLNKNLMMYLSHKRKYTFAVLLTTGALNPIHWGHVDIMEAAKIELEKVMKRKKIRIIAGFMSPSHDSYLHGKFGRNKFIPSKHR